MPVGSQPSTGPTAAPEIEALARSMSRLIGWRARHHGRQAYGEGTKARKPPGVIPGASTALVMRWLADTHDALSAIAPDARAIVAATLDDRTAAMAIRPVVESRDLAAKGARRAAGQPAPRRLHDTEAAPAGRHVYAIARFVVDQLEGLDRRLSVERVDVWSIFRELTGLQYEDRADAFAALVAPQIGPASQEAAARALSDAFVLLFKLPTPWPSTFEEMPADLMRAFVVGSFARVVFGETIEQGAETAARIARAATDESVLALLGPAPRSTDGKRKGKRGPRVASYVATSLFLERDRTAIERLLGAK